MSLGTSSLLSAMTKWFRPCRQHPDRELEVDEDYLLSGGDPLVPLEWTPFSPRDRGATTDAFKRFAAPLSCFLRSLRPGEAEAFRLYLAQAPLVDLPRPLQDDLPVPGLVRHAGRGDVYDANLWMGLPPTYTPLHRDPNPNFFVQMAGTKRVRLLEPDVGGRLFQRVQDELGRRGSAVVRGDEMMAGPERRALDEAVWTGRGGWEARLEPGDALFIPHGWWHSVVSIGAGVNASGTSAIGYAKSGPADVVYKFHVISHAQFYRGSLPKDHRQKEAIVIHPTPLEMEIPQSVKDSAAATKVEYRQLGKSGLKVSVPILGAMSLGHKGWQKWMLDDEQAMPLLKEAYDRGLNTWDTANVYSNGGSEEVIGRTLTHYQIPRHKVVIMTKCWGTVGEEPGVISLLYPHLTANNKEYVNQYGLSRQAIFNAVEASLQRLQTTYIDLLQIHRFDPATSLEETMEALHDLVKSGKVRYIGASSMRTYQFAMMQHVAERHGWTQFVSMQHRYSLLYREDEREMTKYCNLTGVGLIPYATLCRGLLARPVEQVSQTDRSAAEQRMRHLPYYAVGYTDVDVAIIRRVQELATKKGWPMSHVALAWINKRVSSPIVGFTSIERMDDTIAARDKVLTDVEDTFLEELYVPRPIEGHS
ncbi:MAG: hypothetical protein M1826_005941 [Phylliscum demangeonii]|nr:MAG: hypothetical protein M1826_005941 [Phylliscum demangeonii]